MSSQKVVVAKYYAPMSIFKIPKGLDLEDKSVVARWEVKWNKLTICLVKDDEEIEITPTIDASEECDFKRPENCEIAEKNDYYLGGDDDDDEEH